MNVGVQKNALRLRKVVEYVESSAKTVLSYHHYRK